MPCDKLVLLTPVFSEPFERLVKEEGRPSGGYTHCLDLRKTRYQFPVRLYFGGRRTGINKIDFIEVANLGLSRVEAILNELCPYLSASKIYRIDWAVDLLNVAASTVAGSCRVARVHNSAVIRGDGGTSFYPHRSKTRTILIYERAKHLRAKHHPLSKVLLEKDDLTRIEVQFKGKGAPIRQFIKIRDYGKIDLLKEVVFLKTRLLRKGLKPREILEAQGMRALIGQLGLQIASKTFRPPVWAYLRKKFFEPRPRPLDSYIRKRMRCSVLDWLEDRIRFPRARLSASGERE